MNIYDLSDIIERDLVITRHSGQGRRFTAQLEDTWISDDGMLIGSYADGKTPERAVEKYVSLVKGKRIAVENGTNAKRYYTVPQDLTA